VKTPDQAIADVTARLRSTWSQTATDDTLRLLGHADEHQPEGTGSPTWPHSFPLGAPSKADLEQHFAAYQRQVLTWRQWHSDHAAPGVELVEATRHVHRTAQPVPTHLRVADVDVAAVLCGGDWSARLARARSRAATLVRQFGAPPGLPRMLREIGDWTDTDFELLCTAAAWFRDHDATGLTPRQVPVPGLHAKWLNTRQHLVATLAGRDRLPLAPPHPARVHLTYLDPQHRAAGGRLHDCISVADRVQLPYAPQVVVISENKDTAVAFPTVPGGVCVEGGGFGGSTAAALPWLLDAPLLVYWGDIDTAGFEILNGFRAAGVPATSMLMDMATFERYEQFATSLDRNGTLLGPGNRRSLPHLTIDERAVYEALSDAAWQRHRRLEQERIPLAYALAVLRELRPRCAPA
jgi:hypothetical protein